MNSEDPLVADVVATVQSRTPEGWDWKVRVEGNFGTYTLRVILRKRNRLGITTRYFVQERNIADDFDPAEFPEGVLQTALDLLDDRDGKLAKVTPDWAKLAKEIQAMLNGKD